MHSQAVLRLESLLGTRKLDRTVIRAEPEWIPSVSTGFEPLDGLLGGGWRQGEVSEVVGPRSSGRTAVLLSTLAAATANGGIVGLVDAVDRFDPASAATAGVDLDRVLWIRGAPLMAEQARMTLADHAVHLALRALDLLVRAGGFAVVALDLADLPIRSVQRLPFATWLRVAHANANQPTVCLLVGEAAMGRSARGATVELAAASRWTGASPQSRRLAGFAVHARVRDGRQASETRFNFGRD